MPATSTASARVAVSRRQDSSTKSSGAHLQATTGPRPPSSSTSTARATDKEEAPALHAAAHRACRRPRAMTAAASAGAKTSRAVARDAGSFTVARALPAGERRAMTFRRR